MGKELYTDIDSLAESFEIYEEAIGGALGRVLLVKGKLKTFRHGGNTYDIDFYHGAEKLLKEEWFKDYLNNVLEKVEDYLIKVIQLSQERMSIEYDLDIRSYKH